MSKDKKQQTLVPKLRFPEFRDAPEWPEIALKGLLSSISNGLSLTQSSTPPGVPVTRIETISGGSIDMNNVGYIESNDDLSSYRIRAGEILFSNINSIAHIGRSVLASQDLDLYHGMNLLRLRVDSDSNDPRFVFYYLNTPSVRDSIRRRANKAVNQASINQTELGRTRLAAPKIAEQRKISDCLSSLDDLIAAAERKLEGLQKHKQGLMQQLFPRKGETQPRLRFPEFQDAGGWQDKELGPMTRKVGSGITPKGGSRNYKDEGRPFIRSQNVGWGHLILDDVVHIDEETHASFDGSEIELDDVLLNISGASIGRCGVADERIVGGNVNQHVCIIRTDRDSLVPVILSYFLTSESGQRQIDQCQAGGNRQGLNFGQIRSFTIPVPPLVAEQQRIGDCLSALDVQIAAQAKKLDALRTHKCGLMQKLFPAPEDQQ